MFEPAPQPYRISNFKDIPFEWQIAVIIRAYEVNEDVDWSLNEKIDWVNDKDKVDILINDYSNHYPDREFEYGYIKTKDLVEKILESPNFDTMADFYNPSVEDHGDSIIPILVDDKEEDFVEDGWHRLSHYIKNKVRVIPYVKYLV